MGAVGQDTSRPSVIEVGSASRIAGLDGLRAVAVLAVMLFHTAGSPLAGGFLGVDVFFVLSGFLIAGILLKELRGSGRIALGNFWLRRARRLAPALLLLLVAVCLARLAVVHPDVTTWRSDILAALTYTTNWFQISAGGDYFAQFGQPQPLMHTWSLAIEEQFYLMFAVLMAVLLRRAVSRTVLVVFVSLIAASAGWMAWLSFSDPVWAYYGTGTRVQALLVGAVLAVLVERRQPGGAGHAAKVGYAGTAVLVAAFLVPISSAVMFRGGFLVVALATAALIWGILAGGRLATALSWTPLVALGTISYGVYLWHWPVFLLLGTDQASSSAVERAWAFVLTLGLATFSYLALEGPVRRGRFAGLRPVRQWASYAVAAMAVALLALLPARVVPSDSQILWPAAEQLPQRLFVGGDSTMLRLVGYFPKDRYPEIQAQGPVTVGCGIVDVPYTRKGVVQAPDKCVGWQARWADKFDELDPEVAVIGSAVWDSFDRYVDNQNYPPGTPQFDQPFSAAFAEAIALAGGDGQIPVYVMGQPCLSGDVDTLLNDPERSAKIDVLVRTAVNSAPNAHYMDTRALTCTADGTAVDADARQPLREDGVHWGQHGSEVVWSTLFRQLAKA